MSPSLKQLGLLLATPSSERQVLTRVLSLQLQLGQGLYQMQQSDPYRRQAMMAWEEAF